VQYVVYVAVVCCCVRKCWQQLLTWRKCVLIVTTFAVAVCRYDFSTGVTHYRCNLQCDFSIGVTYSVISV